MNYALLLRQAVMLKLASKAKTLKGVILQAKAWNPQPDPVSSYGSYGT